MRMHVDKLAFMSGKENPYFLPYTEYLSFSPGEKIADIQKRSIMNDSVLHILNTSLFFLLDYYGNRDGFYDSVIKNSKINSVEPKKEV